LGEEVAEVADDSLIVSEEALPFALTWLGGADPGGLNSLSSKGSRLVKLLGVYLSVPVDAFFVPQRAFNPVVSPGPEAEDAAKKNLFFNRDTSIVTIGARYVLLFPSGNVGRVTVGGDRLAGKG